jgi:hypothetical protein
VIFGGIKDVPAFNVAALGVWSMASLLVTTAEASRNYGRAAKLVRGFTVSS